MDEDTEDGPVIEPEDVTALRGEVDELQDRLLRMRADFENYRRRETRDREEAALETRARLLRALIPILDDLERALQSDAGEDALRAGVELVRRELLALFEGEGVVVFDPTGQPFDPRLHQAVSHEPVAGVTEGMVAEVLRNGYLLGARLLRPALVKVSSGHEDAIAADANQ
jgi:molecular chaperone GrpE